MAEKRHYIYLIRLTRPASFDKPTPEEEAIIQEHFERLQASLRAGELVLAGPCLDGAFGVVIFAAESEEAALAYMNDDPAVKHGVMAAELHPFPRFVDCRELTGERPASQAADAQS